MLAALSFSLSGQHEADHRGKTGEDIRSLPSKDYRTSRHEQYFQPQSNYNRCCFSFSVFFNDQSFNFQESNVSVDQALFQPFPSEIHFQQFLPHKTHEFPLKFRNLDIVAHNLRVTGEKSPYFSIGCQQPVGMKIAPGMEITYIITFMPEENKVTDQVP